MKPASLLLVCLALVASGCSGGTEIVATSTAAPTTTSTTAAPSTTSTTTQAPTSTTTSSEAPEPIERWLQDEFPEFDMSVDDPEDLDQFAKLIGEFFVFQSWMALHPQADVAIATSYASAVVHPDGPTHQSILAVNSAQIQQAFRLEVPPSEQTLPAFWPGDDGTDGTVLLTARELSKGLVRWLDLDSDTVQREVDNTGSVQQIHVELRQLDNGEWRIWEVTTGA